MLNWIKKIFGTADARTIARYRKIVHQINRQEEEYHALSDEELKAKTEEFRVFLANGRSTEDLLVQAYAVVKNACRRLCGREVSVFGYQQKWDMIPYDEQIIGAIAMHYGSIAEMQTGEGKTLTAAMPLYLRSLTGKPVHLVTVNDYLAMRDCEWIGAIFTFLGLNVSALTGATPIEERKQVYLADIVYGTASEFGFDYLRDNSMAQNKSQQSQRGHYFAIVDEIDSILIDEARTPLIISGPAPAARQMYDELKMPVHELVRLQKNHCTELASAAKKAIDGLHLFDEKESGQMRKLSKEEKNIFEEAILKLWLVGKGMPTNKILKRLKENPDLRGEIESLETYFHAEANKEEKSEKLASLYLTIDERASDFEITDKGINGWSQFSGATAQDFTMLDLGWEYAKIDSQTNLSDKEKIDAKNAMRSEDQMRKEKAHTIRQLCRAHLLMEKDVDYIVQEQKIIIIDENTGRPQPGRRFSEGLHQAIEAKEQLPVQQETQTYATITLQNYFRMYTHLAGMTGTASTEAHEFKQIYKLDVLPIPTHRPCIRLDKDDVVYMTEREKYQGVLQEITKAHAENRPVLVGTDSVEASEKLSRILTIHKIPHQLLNAKNHAKEAEIISGAGMKGSVLVATNMAGRGTDIKLEEGVAALGGLYVIGITRNPSRRVDRQLRGRCGRQGDPGSSIFFISFEDELMRRFNSPTFSTLLQKFRPPEGEPISAPILNRSIETAQKRVEQFHFSVRKHTLEYDDVMNKQRSEVYFFRNRLLHEDDLSSLCHEVLEQGNSEIAKEMLFENDEGELSLEGYAQSLMHNYPVTIDAALLQKEGRNQEAMQEIALGLILAAFDTRIIAQKELLSIVAQAAARPMDADRMIADVLRSMMIRCIDHRWQEHLLAIDHLKAEVSIRSVGQKDPLMEFKQEAFVLFDRFRRNVYLEMSHALFSFQFVLPENPRLKDAIEKLSNDKKAQGLLFEPMNSPQ